MNLDIAKKLSAFVVRTEYESLPAPCVRKAAQCFLDLIGVTLAGAVHPVADAVTAYIRSQGCTPVSTVLGRRIKTSPTLAAFANGAIGHVLEYDDIKTRIGHPSVAIIPAVLALGEQLGSNGKDILKAFVIGFEISSKIANAVEPALSRKGWHATSTVGIFGAAAAAAKLLRLNVEQIRNCFGIAASFASGLVRNFGTSVKPIHAGEAAEKGLKAAILAEKGITADQDMFNGKWGFPHVFACEYRPEQMIANLGEPFEVMGNGFKFYPCCASAHTAIDAVLELMKEEPFSPDDVEKIEVGTVPVNIDNLKYDSPMNPSEAKFSLPFCLATALLKKQVKLEDFTQGWIANPTVQRLMPRINMYLHSDLAHLGYVGTENSIVSITLTNGRVFEKRVDIACGHAENPLTEEALIYKYCQCAAGIATEAAAQKSARMILNIHELDSIVDLFKVLPFKS